MAFMTLGAVNIKKIYQLLLFYVYLLPSLVYYTSHMTFLLSREGASIQNLIFLNDFVIK